MVFFTNCVGSFSVCGSGAGREEGRKERGEG